MTKQEYEAGKLTGAETALLELLEALLQDTRMTPKEKKKKLHKFKEAYPALWRSSIDPCLGLRSRSRLFLLELEPLKVCCSLGSTLVCFFAGGNSPAGA